MPTRVLIIDDFLAGGRTADALVRVCRMANANVVGGGFLIEKLQASLKPTPLLVYPTFTRLAHPTFYPVGTPDLTDSSAHSPSKFNEQDAGRAFLSGYQIPLESLATVSIADDRIEVIDLEGEVEEDDIDEIEEQDRLVKEHIREEAKSGELPPVAESVDEDIVDLP